MTLPQLTDLAASSGDLAREILVRHHVDGDWIPFETIDAATAHRLRADSSASHAKAPAAARGDVVPQGGPARPSARKPKPNLRERIRVDWPIVVGVLVWVCLNAVLWIVLDPFRRTESKYFQIVSDAAHKAREARAQEVDETTRGRIAASVAKELKPIVEELKKSASVSEPIRQHLLWAARDQLPKLFSASGKEFGECDAIFQRHMYEAGRRLGMDVSQPAPPVDIR
jgi:hypothetical protein